MPSSAASAAWSLQSAIWAALTSDTALLAALGASGRIHDHVPRGAEFPYLVVSAITTRDWSTGDLEGEEQTIQLNAWSRGRGKREALAIAAAVRECLHDQPLTLMGHRLVNLRHLSSEIRREADGQTVRASIRLRAVTEPI